MKLQLVLACLLGMACAEDAKKETDPAKIKYYPLSCEAKRFKFEFFDDAECKTKTKDTVTNKIPLADLVKEAKNPADPKCVTVDGITDKKYEASCNFDSDGLVFNSLDLKTYTADENTKCKDVTGDDNIKTV